MARKYRFSEIGHLAQRTLWSLRKPQPDQSATQWLEGFFSANELVLFHAMSATDQAHAVICAQAVSELGDDVIVASALHDVGKTDARLETAGRVLASLCGLIGIDPAAGPRFLAPVFKGLRDRLSWYLNHSEIGAQILTEAGSCDLAISWAREHHFASEDCSLPADLAERLRRADDLA